MVRKDKIGKKSIKIVPLKEFGEPLVVSVPISKVNSFKLLNDVIYIGFKFSIYDPDVKASIQSLFKMLISKLFAV